MKSSRSAGIFDFSLLTFSLLIFSFQVAAQRIAVLAPERDDASRSFADRLENGLAERFRVLDDSMSETAFFSTRPEDPFNLTTPSSMAVGAAMGCDYFILVSSATLRRSSFQRAEYYESHAAVYAVSSRTGRLVFWRLLRFEASKPLAAQNLLNGAARPLATELVNKLGSVTKDELAEPPLSRMDEPPDIHSPDANNFRAPIPYRRIKPEYTSEAFLYDIKATVDIIVDLDTNGSIVRTEIVRWAGYGLDESVEKAVRSMNWRPATRNGKPLPMRFLIRYNFKKIEKE